MENRLTQEQLKKVVAEVQRLSLSREGEVDREQVKEILQELNLPPDLLDDALVQVQRRDALEVQRRDALEVQRRDALEVQRRDALEVQQRGNRWVIGGVAVVLIGAIAAITMWLQNRQSAIANVKGSQACITLVKDSCSNLGTVERQGNSDVYYRVTLQNAPVGEKLDLRCDWIDPSGQVVHQNRYSTQKINTIVWPTYCHYQLGSAASGTWKVQMLAGDRILSSTNFVVK